MGDLPTKKTYIEIDQMPILTRTLFPFDRHSAISEIVVTVSETDLDFCRSTAIAPFKFRKTIKLVVGGETRQKSVFNGLKKISDKTEIVVIHDGVRPFVDQDLISETIVAADQFGSAVVAVPVKDTIKIVDDKNFVIETPDRSRLWAVQTPQAFRKDLLLRAHRIAEKNGTKATDDAMLVEQIGERVKLIESNYRNIKITTPEDLKIAKSFLEEN